jgi:hypothetical protein
LTRIHRETERGNRERERGAERVRLRLTTRREIKGGREVEERGEWGTKGKMERERASVEEEGIEREWVWESEACQGKV